MRVGVHADHPGKTVLRAVLEGGLAEKWNVEKGVDEGKQFVEGDQILEASTLVSLNANLLPVASFIFTR
eukprot:4293569-Amphidinium_carterae.1